MSFDETLRQIREILQRERRVAYRALKRRFALNDEDLEDLKAEFIEAQQIAHDENDRVLVWAGDTHNTSLPASAPDVERSPWDVPVAAPLVSATEAQRRQLTVMFCDLVGSAPLAEKLDPEELREVIHTYQASCQEKINDLGGYVARYMGDGLLAYFGYPLAHEDAAEQAVHAGLQIIAAQPSLQTQCATRFPACQQQPLQVRIGIHTGLVVIGEMGGADYREQVALGEAPNIAARVQGFATPNTVALSEMTYRLVEGLFACQDLGLQTLKGISAPLRMFQAISPGAAQSRFAAREQMGLLPLVGRTQEMRLLGRLWQLTQRESSQVGVISGEPGIGKSRLVRAFRDQIDQRHVARLEFHCTPRHQHTALYPIVTLLQQVLQFNPEDAPHTKLEKLEQALSGYQFPEPDTVSLLASLLSLPQPAALPALGLSPEKHRQKTLETLVDWIREEARQRPVYCVGEDLQWADQSTLELLGLCIDTVPTVQMLLVLTCRPEFVSPWPVRPYLTQLTLQRLEQSQAKAIVAHLMEGRTLPAQVLEQILVKTDGVPIFVEELTKMLKESDRLRAVNNHYELIGSLSDLAIPATLQDSLMARLDRLTTAKDVAQVGAVLGREFSYDLLRAVMAAVAVTVWPDASLQQELSRLVDAELISQYGNPAQPFYVFRHALIQDAAYQSLLKRKAQHVHQHVAQVLEEQFAQTAEAQPELLAHHYTQAECIQQALPYWHQAGQRAGSRAAHAEAVQQLTTALDLLASLPPDQHRDRLELGLQVSLGASLSARYGAAEVEQTYQRAQELCQQLGETRELFPVVRGLATFYMTRGNHAVGHELAQQCMRLAQTGQDEAFLIEACVASGFSAFYSGDLQAARETLEHGLQLYDTLPQEHASAFLTPQDPGIACLSLLAQVTWLLGYPEQAQHYQHNAIQLAQDRDQPFNTGYASIMAAEFALLRRELNEAASYAQQAIQVGNEYGFGIWSLAGSLGLSIVKSHQGEPHDAIATLPQLIAEWRARGLELSCPDWFIGLAESYRAAGQLHQALATINEAIAHGQAHGEHWLEAVCYRLRGEYRLAHAPHAQKVQEAQKAQEAAQADFRHAIAIARRQQAKVLELQATVRLSRLWQQQGRPDAARSLLSDIYSWFTEGCESPHIQIALSKDLQDATALLAEL